MYPIKDPFEIHFPLGQGSCGFSNVRPIVSCLPYGCGSKLNGGGGANRRLWSMFPLTDRVPFRNSGLLSRKFCLPHRRTSTDAKLPGRRSTAGQAFRALGERWTRFDHPGYPPNPFVGPKTPGLAVGQDLLFPGEHQNGWQMDVHPPQNGAIGIFPMAT